MTKIFRTICLVTIGLVFIFSGFVKAVDPVGYAIKFTDYFNAFGLPFLSVLSMPLSILFVSIEFLIGTHLLMHIRVRQVAWLTLVLQAFFTLLTLYLAIANPVSDCGCFGDAVKLTNWETFYKNLVLLPMVVFVFAQRKNVISPLEGWRQWTLSLMYVALVLAVAWIGIEREPLMDFRPYKTGTHIPTAMSIPAGAEQPLYDTRFIMEKDGIRKEFGVNDYPYTDSSWVFINTKTTTLKEGYQPPIQHFTVNSLAGEDMTNQLLADERPVFLLLSPKVEKADASVMKTVAQLNELALEKGFGLYCVTSSLQPQIQDFDIKMKVGLNYLTCDETEIKTITRSNPALILLQQGTIIGKWNAKAIKDARIFANPVAGALSLARQRYETLALVLLGSILVLVTSLFFIKKS